ncbi:MAG: divalent-cation tolerance protein CutA [Myxococcales bacterium]|nr:divalent-cation tolerance protein CutA [Myxococcales bacterium]
MVLINTPPGDAERIAKALVEARLCACVNVLPGVKSFYHWEGKLEDASESTLLVKTRKALLPELTEAVKAIHPYSVPEVIALDIDASAGNADYLRWVLAETTRG